MNESPTRKLVLGAFFAALPVALSIFPGSILVPGAGAKVLPWQHMTNAIAGVMLGPWYAALAATIAAIIRNLLGVGTPLAFPGSIPGALVVGFAYCLWRRNWVALLEPLGTGPIGATIGALVIAPAVMGRVIPFMTLQIAFLIPSVLGSIVGFVLLVWLERIGVPRVSEARE